MTDPKRREFLKASLAALAAGVAGCHQQPIAPSAMCYTPPIRDVNAAGQVSEHPEQTGCLEPLAKSEPPRELSHAATTTEEQTLKRAELVERLQQLAESTPPQNLSPGAMCYRPAGRRMEERPCPECERTMRVGEKDEILRAFTVPLRRIRDQGVDATLLVPEHCSTCGFGLKSNRFQLEIRYPDYPDVVRVELNSLDAFEMRFPALRTINDLELIVLFLEGRDRFRARQGREIAIRDRVDRLRELFGIAE